MATFTPGPGPTQDVPYINWSREIGNIPPNESGAILARGAGQALEGLVNTLDTAEKKGIQNTIYSQVDPIQESFMNTLHDVDMQVTGNKSLLNPNTGQEGHPQDLKQLPDTLDTLGSARANGKLTQTDYDARLNALAKQIRSQYPGYREYVDETFRRATGRDSANQYIRSVIGDIDSYRAKGDDNRKAVESRLLTEGFHYQDGDKMYQLYRSNPQKYEAAVLSWLNQQQANDHDLEMLSKRTTLQKETYGFDKEQAKDQATRIAGQVGVSKINSQFQTFWLASGATDAATGKASQAWQDELDRLRRGDRAQLSDEEHVKMGTAMQARRAALKTQLLIQFADDYHGGISTSDALGGPAAAEELVEKQLASYYDPISKALSEGKLDLAHMNKNIAAAAADDKYAQMLQGPYRNALLFQQVLHEKNPTLGSYAAQQSFSMEPNLAGIYGAVVGKIAVTPGGGYTVSDALDGLKHQGFDPNNPEQAKIYKNVLSFVKQGLGNKDTSPEGKANIADALYSDKNAGLLAMFDKPVYTGVRGRFIDRNMMYDQLLSRDMVDQTAKLSFDKHGAGEQDQHYWKNLFNMSQTWFADVVNRDQLVSMGEKHAALANAAIHYNSETGEFRLPPAFEKQHQFADTVKELKALSSNIKTLRYVYEKNNSDPEAGVYASLQAHKADPDSLVGKMLSAMEAAHNDRKQ